MIGSAMAKRAWGLAVMFVAGCSRGEAMPADDAALDVGADLAAEAPSDTALEASGEAGDGATEGDAAADGDADAGAPPVVWSRTLGAAPILFRGPDVVMDATGVTTFAGFLLGACPTFVSVVRFDPKGAPVFQQCIPDAYEGRSLALDAAGATYVGTQPAKTTVDHGAGVTKLDGKGDVAWRKLYYPATPDNGTMTRSLALVAGDVVAGAHTKLPVDFGAGLVGGKASSTAVVLRLSSATGATLSVRTLGDCTGCGATDVLGVAGDAATIYLAGEWHGGPTDLGDGPIAATSGAFVLAVEPGGKNRWVKQLGGSPAGWPSLAVGPKGELVYADTAGTDGLDFGGGVKVPSGPYVAVFEPDGTPRWAKATSGAPGSVAVLDGRVWVAGSRAEGATAIQSAWLARLALADGALLGENWPGRTVAAAHQGITGIALSPAGVAPIGVFRDTIRFGDVTLSATPTDAGPPLDATAFLVLLRPY